MHLLLITHLQLVQLTPAQVIIHPLPIQLLLITLLLLGEAIPLLLITPLQQDLTTLHLAILPLPTTTLLQLVVILLLLITPPQKVQAIPPLNITHLVALITHLQVAIIHQAIITLPLVQVILPQLLMEHQVTTPQVEVIQPHLMFTLHRVAPVQTITRPILPTPTLRLQMAIQPHHLTIHTLLPQITQLLAITRHQVMELQLMRLLAITPPHMVPLLNIQHHQSRVYLLPMVCFTKLGIYSAFKPV